MRDTLKLPIFVGFTILAAVGHAQIVPGSTGHGPPSFNCAVNDTYGDVDTNLVWKCYTAPNGWAPTPYFQPWGTAAAGGASLISSSPQNFNGPVTAPQISDVFTVDSGSPTSGTVGGTPYTTAIDLAVAKANAWMTANSKNALLKVAPGAWPTCKGVQLDSTAFNLNVQGAGQTVTRVFQSCTIAIPTLWFTASSRFQLKISDIEFDAVYLAPYSCIIGGAQTQVSNVQCSNAAGKVGTVSTISTAVRASGTTTITTSAAHGLSAGDYVTIAGVTDTSFNGRMHVATVTSSTVFTFAQAGIADSSSSAGTATQESAAMVIGPADNEAGVYEDKITNVPVLSNEASLGAASVTAAVTAGATTGFSVVSGGAYKSFAAGNRSAPGTNLSVNVYGCTTLGSATVTTSTAGGGVFAVTAVNQVTPWSGCGTTAYVQVGPQFRVQYGLVIGNVTDSTFTDLIPTQPAGTAEMQVTHPYNTFIHPHPYRGAPVLIEEHGGNSYFSPEFDSPGGYGMSLLGTQTKIKNALFMWDQQYPGSSEFFLGLNGMGATTIDGIYCGRAQSAGGMHDFVTLAGPADTGAAMPTGIVISDTTRCDSTSTFPNNAHYSYQGNPSVGPTTLATSGNDQPSGTLGLCDSEFSAGTAQTSCWQMAHTISLSGFTSTLKFITPSNSVASVYKTQVAAIKPATSSNNFAAPLSSFVSNYWTGSVSGLDTWDCGVTLPNGTNASPKWGCTHTPGSTGQPVVTFPYPVQVGTFTVATLPSASTVGAGSMVVISDATTLTAGTCTGGGTNTMIAVSNGTAWSCH